MSEFTEHNKKRVIGLQAIFTRIIEKDRLSDLIHDYEELLDSVVPSDIIDVVHQLVGQEVPMDELKAGINKLLNLVSSYILKQPYRLPPEGSFMDALVKSNEAMEIRLRKIRPLLKEINKDATNEVLRQDLRSCYMDLNAFEKHYSIMENVLFPVLEKQWENFKCVQVMWSFHDTIRSNIKSLVGMLEETPFDLKQLNRLSGDISFNMFAMKFRTERLLIPQIEATIGQELQDNMLRESIALGFPFTSPQMSQAEISHEGGNGVTQSGDVDLKTGFMSPEQVRLVFNHLPVDITYVDENDFVRFYSTPKNRIFPRTNSIIGREVKNCHPPESVHVVEEIVDAFKKGEKDVASFWIKMKGEFILIQYFAIRNDAGEYKGVVEVSQEISEIRSLEGEKRLLDWA